VSVTISNRLASVANVIGSRTLCAAHFRVMLVRFGSDEGDRSRKRSAIVSSGAASRIRRLGWRVAMIVATIL
jgi:hypothetical protein